MTGDEPISVSAWKCPWCDDGIVFAKKERCLQHMESVHNVQCRGIDCGGIVLNAEWIGCDIGLALPYCSRCVSEGNYYKSGP